MIFQKEMAEPLRINEINDFRKTKSKYQVSPLPGGFVVPRGRCVNNIIDNCGSIWNSIQNHLYEQCHHPPSPGHPPIDISRNPEFRLMDYLAEVEERIKHKIEQIEEEIDTTDERQNTDRLIPNIETLDWVFNEILVLDKDG